MQAPSFKLAGIFLVQIVCMLTLLQLVGDAYGGDSDIILIENTISINSYKDIIGKGKEKLDTEEDIERAAEKIMEDTRVSKLEALNMLLGRYQSQRRLEEAVRVQRIIDREQAKTQDYGKGFQQDM
jgi:hypothetical protein